MQSELLVSVTFVGLDIEVAHPPLLTIDVSGQAYSGNYTAIELVPVAYTEAPADGIYEFELKGKAPEEEQEQDLTEVDTVYRWENFPAALKGVKVLAADNSLVELVYDDEPEEVSDNTAYDDIEDGIEDDIESETPELEGPELEGIASEGTDEETIDDEIIDEVITEQDQEDVSTEDSELGVVEEEAAEDKIEEQA
jgi:hypothetical protein